MYDPENDIVMDDTSLLAKVPNQTISEVEVIAPIQGLNSVNHKIIAVNNLGVLIENPAENRTNKEIYANSWIYNTSARYQVNDEFTAIDFNPSDLPLYQIVDRSSLKKGDTVDLFNRSSNNILDTGKVTAPSLDPTKWWITKTNNVTLGLSTAASGQYDIRRKLNSPISIGASLSASHLVSDVQNLYVDDKNEEFYIASNSLPSGTAVGTGLYFNSAVPFINGDEVSYSSANDPYIGLQNGGTYFVGIASDSSDKKTIRLYSSRATVNTDNYIKLETSSGSITETGHSFTLLSQKSKLIGPQNLFKKFPFNPDIKSGKQTKTLPGTI